MIDAMSNPAKSPVILFVEPSPSPFRAEDAVLLQFLSFTHHLPVFNNIKDNPQHSKSL